MKPAHDLRLILCAALAINGCARAPNAGDPIDGLSRDERQRFLLGRAQFERVFTPETGLGPLFNAESCAECHENPAAGGSGDEIETHVSAYHPDRPDVLPCDPLANEGGPVIQQHATPALTRALGIDREPVPDDVTATALRTPPALFGFGLLDAVPDSLILALADPDDRNHDGVSGRPNRNFDGRIGRFGRKALVPTLDEFNHGAFAIEQGITNPAVPTEETVGGQPLPEGVDSVPEPEISQETMERVDDFVRFLAPPAARALSTEGRRGRKLFHESGCQTCHVPTLVTGKHAVKALRYRRFAAYTDLLLHDMGPDLADICLGLAEPPEFRTEPLAGLRFAEAAAEGEPHFLHDGRAHSIEEAIQLHGGEASAARARFVVLSPADRAALVEFLRSL